MIKEQLQGSKINEMLETQEELQLYLNQKVRSIYLNLCLLYTLEDRFIRLVTKTGCIVGCNLLKL